MILKLFLLSKARQSAPYKGAIFGLSRESVPTWTISETALSGFYHSSVRLLDGWGKNEVFGAGSFRFGSNVVLPLVKRV